MRPIDANALCDKLTNTHDFYIDAWGGFQYLSPNDQARVDELSACIANVLNAPTIDVEPVVRCKDCKHYGWEQDPCHGRTERFCKLHKGLVMVNKETFCSYGERKNNETN